MKRFLMVAALAIGSISFNSEAIAQVSVNVGLPGFYGTIDVGGYPQPQVIYQQPRVIEYVPNNQPAVYMRVPRDHRRNWRRHCGYYNACNQRVYFVRDDWYRREYAPRYQEQHGERGEDRGDEHGGYNRGGDYDNNRGKKHHDNGKHRGHGRKD
jgi:hypothetical protein